MVLHVNVKCADLWCEVFVCGLLPGTRRSDRQGNVVRHREGFPLERCFSLQRATVRREGRDDDDDDNDGDYTDARKRERETLANRLVRGEWCASWGNLGKLT